MVNRQLAGARGLVAAAGVLLLAAQLLGLLPGCSEDTSTRPDPPDAFVVAESISVELDLPAGSTINDELTGLGLSFPQGASDWLTTGTLGEAPPRPWEGGQGYYLTYEGREPLQVLIPQEPGGYTFLLCYGRPAGSQGDGGRERWFAVPEVDTVPDAHTKGNLLVYQLRTCSDVDGCEGGQYFWRVDFTAGSDEAVAFAAGIASAAGFLQTWRDSLAETFQLVDGARSPEELPATYYPDGDYYCGFRRPCDSVCEVDETEPAPRIGISLDAPSITVAHQVGHYLTHLLIGDERYAALEDGIRGDHGVGVMRPWRLGIGEDYAHFFEYLLAGEIGGAGDPNVPAEFFPDPAPSPAETDLPSIVGYGVLLMHALMRSDSTIHNLRGEEVRVPVVGLSRRALITQLLAPGAPDMDYFRLVVEDYLAWVGQGDCLAPLAAAAGWQPTGYGKVIGRDWEVYEGAEVVALTTVDGHEYYSAAQPLISTELGWFDPLPMFPGSQTLRVRAGADSFEFDAHAGWLIGTQQPVQLLNLYMWPDLTTLNRIAVTLNIETERAEDDSVTVSPFLVSGYVSCDGPGVFAEQQIHVPEPVDFNYGQTDKDWRLDTLAVAYSWETGDVTEFLMRASRLAPEETEIELRASGPLRAEISGTRKLYFGHLEGVTPDEVREVFSFDLTGPGGHAYTEEDLIGDGQTIVVKVYRA